MFVFKNVRKDSSADDANQIIKIDPITGLSEFPAPGTNRQLLPTYIDPEEVCMPSVGDVDDGNANGSHHENAVKDMNGNLWMPDKLCKVCYGCDDPFTMYRRRHHCRMCGQIFCNPCSSLYVDGASVNPLWSGPVRSCRLCHDQLIDRIHTENKQFRRRMIDITSNETIALSPNNNTSHDVTLSNNTNTHTNYTDHENVKHFNNLQNRAYVHLEAIIEMLCRDKLDSNHSVSNADEWRKIIIHLVREVVSTVDPNVRRGDGVDIRPYVKLKIIPGGSMDENGYIDGIVFRKNASHKKMISYCPKHRPRILVLTGGIEFQRTDNRLSSMDTLIEQEDKYMEIIVQKIMSLKPDMIFVGKFVARKAQELLVGMNVVVMQNVKSHLLERISRLTGAMMLPSTDHMIQQYGEECLGSCGNFWFRQINDTTKFNGDDGTDENSSSSNSANSKAITVVGNTKISAKTEIGGGILKQKTIRGSTYAYLQGCPPDMGCTIVLRGATKKVLSIIKSIIRYAIVVAYHLRLEVAYYNDRCVYLPENPIAVEQTLMSSSLDIYAGTPDVDAFRGGSNPSKQSIIQSDGYDAQSILVTSLLMTDGSVQKSKAEIKGLKYYSMQQDIALGQFLIESCFTQKQAGANLIDHTLSFVHQTGRIDISVHRITEGNNSIHNIVSDGLSSICDPLLLPIYISSYCKECDKIVSPDVLMSEETWKMSFGKFLEISFYNESAYSRNKSCTHCMRDSHLLFFTCEGQTARIDFTPIYPFSIHIRTSMEFPYENHFEQFHKCMLEYTTQYIVTIEAFYRAVNQLECEVIECLHNRPEDIATVLNSLKVLEDDLQKAPMRFSDATIQAEDIYRFIDSVRSHARSNGHVISNSDFAAILKVCTRSGNSDGGDAVIPTSLLPLLSTVGSDTVDIVDGVLKVPHIDQILLKYPMHWKREAYLVTLAFKKRFNGIYRFIDSVKHDDAGLAGGGGGVLASLQNTLLGVHMDDSDDNDFDIDEAHDTYDSSLHRHTVDMAHVGSNSDSSTTHTHTLNSTTKPVAIGGDDGDHIRSASVAATGKGNKSESGVGVTDKAKSNRIAKALSRLMTGKEMHISDKTKNSISLGSLGDGRLGLKVGRHGEVIAVHDDEVATIIAYSLASEEYHAAIQDETDMSTDFDFTISDTNAFRNDADDDGIPSNRHGHANDAPDSTPTPVPLVSPIVTTAAAVAFDGNDSSSSTNGDSSAGFSLFSHNAYHDGDSNEHSTTSTGSNSANANHDDGYSPPITTATATISTSNVRSSHSTGASAAASSGSGSGTATTGAGAGASEKAHAHHDSSTKDAAGLRARMTSQKKLQIRHQFADKDNRGNVQCKFVCDIYWATQFEALRASYLNEEGDAGFIRSLSGSTQWLAQGGKSGAKFSKTTDDRFIVKVISKVELQMFLEFAPAYFDYMVKALFDNLYYTVLCKILGVYTIGYHNKETNRKLMANVVIMENIFYQRNITKIFDLKGSSKSRYVDPGGEKINSFDKIFIEQSKCIKSNTAMPRSVVCSKVLLDDNLMELSGGRPFPLKHASKVFFNKAILNDTSFLEIINVVDYSILVGFDEDTHEIVVGVIDYMRQYDFIKRMERMGKSVGMLAGQLEPTIIQPPQYRKRFTAALEKYFMTAPDKYLSYDA